jgi:hypothetical protein
LQVTTAATKRSTEVREGIQKEKSSEILQTYTCGRLVTA